MKIIKGIGIAIMIIALATALGFAGRIETEDIDYRRGEITKSDMTSDSDVIRGALILGGTLISGGLIYAAGCGMELWKEKREARERWFDDDEEIY